MLLGTIFFFFFHILMCSFFHLFSETINSLTEKDALEKFYMFVCVEGREKKKERSCILSGSNRK